MVDNILLQEIKDLYNKYPMPSSKEEIELITEKELTTPFQTITKEGTTYVALPSNYAELVENNYFFKILNKLIVNDVYKPVKIDKTYVCRLKIGAPELTFLKAFAFQTFSNNMEPLPVKKTQLYHGLASAQKIILCAIKDLDISLYKQKNAKTASTVIFGDPYGKNYPIEKKILDKMIHTLRTSPFDCKFYDNFIPMNEIVKDKGLKVDTSSDLLTEDEIAAANLLMEKIGKFELPNEQDMKTSAHAIEFQKHIQDFQKKVKTIKIGIGTIVSERITACFSPYTGSARIKAKKEKITTLIANAKTDKEYFKAFNPSMVLLLVGKPRQISQIPQNWGKEQFTDFINKFEEIIDEVFDEDLGTNIAATYIRYLEA
jgi:hypothetical protein